MPTTRLPPRSPRTCCSSAYKDKFQLQPRVASLPLPAPYSKVASLQSPLGLIQQPLLLPPASPPPFPTMSQTVDSTLHKACLYIYLLTDISPELKTAPSP